MSSAITEAHIYFHRNAKENYIKYNLPHFFWNLGRFSMEVGISQTKKGHLIFVLIYISLFIILIPNMFACFLEYLLYELYVWFIVF